MKVTVPLLSSQEAEIIINSLVSNRERTKDGFYGDTVRSLQSQLMIVRDVLVCVENAANRQAERYIEIEQ